MERLATIHRKLKVMTRKAERQHDSLTRADLDDPEFYAAEFGAFLTISSSTPTISSFSDTRQDSMALAASRRKRRFVKFNVPDYPPPPPPMLKFQLEIDALSTFEVEYASSSAGSQVRAPESVCMSEDDESLFDGQSAPSSDAATSAETFSDHLASPRLGLPKPSFFSRLSQRSTLLRRRVPLPEPSQTHLSPFSPSHRHTRNAYGDETSTIKSKWSVSTYASIGHTAKRLRSVFGGQSTRRRVDPDAELPVMASEFGTKIVPSAQPSIRKSVVRKTSGLLPADYQ